MKLYTRTSDDIKPVEKPAYWSARSKDFETRQNLILGKEPYIDAGNTDDCTAAHYNTPIEKGTMTDGILPDVIDYDEAHWFKFMHSKSRDIIFDLGKTSSVDGCMVQVLYQKAGAVYFPRNFKVSLSDNGVDYEKIYSKKEFKIKSEAEIREIEIDFKEKISARFIKFSFDVDCWVFIGEIEVYGTKKIQPESRALKPVKARKKKPAFNADKYLMPEDFMGIHDVLLAYNCHPTHRTKGKLSVEEMMPLVGYYDRNGNLKDYFFDSFLFLPFAAFPIRKEDTKFDIWHTYLDNTFAEGWNTDAVDFAFGETKKKLGDENTDKKAQIFLSILYPFDKYKDFGDLFGEGKGLDFKDIEDRKRAVKWFIDENLRRFEAKHYSYSSLAGFYWFEEWLFTYKKEEIELVKYACDYVHSKGLKVIWIPYYCSEGYNDWRRCDIDFACMQPNYSFRDYATTEIIDSCAEICRREGMCVEMEIGGTTDYYIDRYNEYLNHGVTEGYMDAVHMYYHGGGPGVFYDAYKSDNKKLNDVYHNTYLFTKHKYKPEEK